MILERKNMADDEYLRRHEHEEFARRVDQENKRQNRRLDIVESTLSQLNELTISVQNLATNMKHMLDIQTEQNKRLEELENRDGEKWRSISKYVLTALIGVVLGFAFKQVGI